MSDAPQREKAKKKNDGCWLFCPPVTGLVWWLGPLVLVRRPFSTLVAICKRKLYAGEGTEKFRGLLASLSSHLYVHVHVHLHVYIYAGQVRSSRGPTAKVRLTHSAKRETHYIR